MKNQTVISVFGAALACSLVVATAAAGTGRSTSAGRVLFTRAGGEFQDETVFVISADGTGEHRITKPGASCCPRWSPDGTHVLMAATSSHGKRITTAITDARGGHKRTLPLPGKTLNLGPGAWSANGARIAFEGWADRDPSAQGIYVGRSSDGGNLVRVTHCTPAQDDRTLGWSPDGSKIYFFRARARFHKVTNEPLGSLYVVDVNGAHMKRVTPPSMAVEVAGNAGGKISRDGKWIAFTSSGVLWKIRSSGSELSKVYEDPQGQLAITPTWSPDGKLILFGLDPTDTLAVTDNAPPNGLYTVHADGTGLAPFLVSNDWKREPDWVR